jgi:hypothetical protein
LNLHSILRKFVWPCRRRRAAIAAVAHSADSPRCFLLSICSGAAAAGPMGRGLTRQVPPVGTTMHLEISIHPPRSTIRDLE